jgi:hypothetical protein
LIKDNLDKDGQLFIADYDKSDEQLYIECAIFSLLEEKSFKSLSVAQPYFSQRMPSWAPDWSSYSMGANSLSIVEPFRVMNNLEMAVAVSKDQKVLTLHGILLDRISVIGTRQITPFFGHIVIE